MKNKIPGIFIFIIIINILGILLSLRDIISGNQVIIGIYALKGIYSILYRITMNIFDITVICLILLRFKYTMVILYTLYSIGLLISSINLFCHLFLSKQFLENGLISNISYSSEAAIIIIYSVIVSISIIFKIIILIFIRKNGYFFKKENNGV
jgi:hypothetical protein